MAAVRERERAVVVRARPAARPAQPEAPSEPSLLRLLAVFLPALALLVAFEIALAFTVAYLVTGRAY
jgi:hypothetical protein